MFQDEKRKRIREQEYREIVDPTGMLDNAYDQKSKFQFAVAMTLKEMFKIQAQSLERLTALEDNDVQREQLDAALAAKLTNISKQLGKRERNIEVMCCHFLWDKTSFRHVSSMFLSKFSVLAANQEEYRSDGSQNEEARPQGVPDHGHGFHNCQGT